MGCARLWRYPPGTRGRRHADEAQEDDSDEDVVVFIYGAPPVQAGAEFFDDPEP